MSLSCLICRVHFIDPRSRFDCNPDHVKVLCKLLRLPLTPNYPDSDVLVSFPDLLQSASYCPACVWKVKAIGHILKDIEELERRLDEHRSEIEKQLKNNLNTATAENSCPENSNQLIWKSVINYIQKTKTPEVEPHSELDLHLDPVDPLEIEEGQGQGHLDFDYDLPGSPPSNFENIVENYEQKYDPSQEVQTQFSGQIPPSGEGHAAAVAYSALLDKHHFPGPRRRCWFADDCNVWISKDDPISSDAHRLKYHEGVQKCYVCKICHEGFLTYKALRYHARSHIPGQDAERSMTLTLKKKFDLDEKKSAEIMNSAFPVVRLKRLEDTAGSEAEVEPAEVKVKVKVKGQEPKKPQKRTKYPYEGCHLRFRDDEVKRRDAHLWKEHERNREDYLCDRDLSCTARFTSLQKWHDHITAEHTQGGNPAPYLCPFCALDCAYFSRLRQHVLSVHEPHKAKYKCAEPGCSKVFLSCKNFYTHKQSHAHARARYLCEFCSASFTCSQRLKYHTVSKHSDEPYKCKICAKTFGSPPNLKFHIQNVHQKITKFKCPAPDCGFGTLRRSELIKHELFKHNAQRPFMCEKCPATFKTKPCLDKHAQSHEGVRAYKCTMRNCGATFVYKNRLRRHELVMHSKTPPSHVCNICGKKFPIKNYLTNHVNYSHKNIRCKSQLPKNGKKSSNVDDNSHNSQNSNFPTNSQNSQNSNFPTNSQNSQNSNFPTNSQNSQNSNFY